MSRSGYSENCGDNWETIRWRGIIASATRGKRGQAFFRALVAALDAMPEKKLISGHAKTYEGVCALGALGEHRGADIADIDKGMRNWDFDRLGEIFDIAPQLTQEVMYENDDRHCKTPEERWRQVRAWAEGQIKEPKP